MLENFPESQKTVLVLKRVALRPAACGPITRGTAPGYMVRCRRKVEPQLHRLRNRGREGSGQRVRIALRPYQETIFNDRSSGILILHWSRQIGKSFTLAAWAVDRLLSRPGRLVTVLSNSRENGAEFVAKCAEVCQLNGTEYESVDKSQGVRFQNMRMEVRIRAQGKTGRIKVLAANPRTARGFSGDLILDEFAFHEDSAAIWEAAEPILASNPDFLCRIASTGNGRHNLFYRMVAPATMVGLAVPSEPQADGAHIEVGLAVSSEPEADGAHMGVGRVVPNAPSSCTLRPSRRDGPTTGICTSTPGFKVSREGEPNAEVGQGAPLAAGTCGAHMGVGLAVPSEPQADGALGTTRPTVGICQSALGFKVSRITRTQAHQMGVRIYDSNTREPITPDDARAQALDKRAYDQNYECSFADENLTLLSHELISAAERDDVGFICEQDWSAEFLRQCRTGFQPVTGDRQDACPSMGYLYVGFDVGRKVDLSVITVMEDLNGLKLVRGILRIQNLRLPEQQLRLGEICRLPKFRRAAIDMTGLGLGLFEYAQKQFGSSRIYGVNFSTTVPATRAVALEGRKRETVRVTEALAMELLQVYEDRRIQHPADARLRDDLRKPEKITSPGGRVSIAATRDEAGHADHFWSMALAVEASGTAGGEFVYRAVERLPRGVLV